MSILEVNDLKKIYTTRFGGQKVEALQSGGYHGGIRQRQNHAA